MRNHSLRSILFFAIVPALGCGGDTEPEPPPEEQLEEPLDELFESIPAEGIHPPDNPYSEAKANLGELLFWDPILSGDLNVACASCHHPAHGWADGRERSIGVDGQGLGPGRVGEQVTDFNSPTVLDVAFGGLDLEDDKENFVAGPFFWDARAETLEDQALGPIQNGLEMLGPNFTEEEALPLVVSRLQAIDEYATLFDEAFGGPDPITAENIARAIATFERTLVSGRTPFDDYLDGNETALSADEVSGLVRFVNRGCARCHGGVMLSDQTVHEDEPIIIEKPAVRTPSLRNLAFTAPYMHDGSEGTLADVLQLYDDREDDLDITFADPDLPDVLAFLEALRSDDFYRGVPESVPSGLKVGGDID